ncbi:MAG: putative lipid II flippase FtsW [Deltaproteobacteria bacterium]|jgi:cell division protein FtsW|nr:putative lipid II flippase FtsW [Deltaproteobacteria bacterium]
MAGEERAAPAAAAGSGRAAGRPGLLRSVDTHMLAIFILLLGLGTTTLLSASYALGNFEVNDPYHYYYEQLWHLLVGLGVAAGLFLVPYWVWIRYAWLWGLVAVGVLVIMLIPGVAREVKGASRWLAFIPFQPSEAAKLAVAIVLARYFSFYGELSRRFWYGVGAPLLIMVIFGGLIVAERDLGGAVVIGIIVVLMMVAGGVRTAHLACLSPLVLVVNELVATFGYRISRITSWDDPWQDPTKTGYNIIHSFYAFASGGWHGVWPGNGQQKMFFLPESHTDYIFAVVGEEMGLVGVCAVSLLFLALAWRGMMTARSAKTVSGFHLALGMTLCVVVPAFINMCVALSIIPAKGLPLPFFSYGGSSMVVSCAAMGIILGVYSQSLRDTGNAYVKAAPARPRAGAAAR